MTSENKEQLRNRAISGAAWKFAERICAQIVSMTVAIVLARILVPDDYSVVSIVGIFFSVCNVLISGGFNAALIQKKNADAMDYSSVLAITVAVSTVLYGVMFFCASAIAELYSKPILTPIIRVMGLTFFINAYKSILAAYVSSNLKFRMFFFATIIGTVTSAVIGISMAVEGFGPWALVAQQMSNSLIDTIVLQFTARYRFSLRVSWERVKSLFSYGWKLFASSMINTVYDECCPMIVGIKFSGVDLAYYNKGRSFPALINSSVVDSLSAVLFPVISKVQDDAQAVLAATRRYIKTASYVIFPLMVGFLAVSESFVVALLTEKWIMAVPYVQIFCLSYMLNVVQVGNLQAIKAVGRSDIFLILEIIKKSVYFAIIAAFVFLSDTPRMLAMSAVICSLVAMVINTWPNRKLIGYKYRYQFMDLLPNFLLTAAMGAIVLLMGQIPLPSGLLLILQILTGGGVYVLLSVITRNESFLYVLNLVKQKVCKRK